MLKLRLLPLKPKMLGYLQKSFYCDNVNAADEEKEREIERIKKSASLDEPPTACCRSGCANCVFIVWAEALATKFETAGPEITEKIMKEVDDPSMRAYLELELRIRGLKKS
ncbi:oxidoreductase-like domain-containing protein 1 [Vanessa tameamea]|uniref:Oxidoreductase-like domain-containing protein 1 n=1 Tax=Vanessa tameamea TaxID=334116 RepID=A0A8B8HQ81_VANTA|nr:oxidoreductase-like domain-containing protein 1 [Vanessa tameamea]